MNKRYVTHACIWATMMLFPLIFVHPSDTLDFTLGRLVRALSTTLGIMMVFYLNYLWLTPKLFGTKRLNLFIAINLVAIVLVMGFNELWWDISIQLMPTTDTPIPDDRPEFGIPPHKQHLLFFQFVSLMLTVVGSVAIRLARRARELEKSQHEIMRMKNEAELKALRNQVNPHFLLNTLNNIYALIAFDQEKAQRSVDMLSQMLRYVLTDNNSTTVPLGNDIKFIKNLIELQRLRLPGSVTVTTSIDISEDSKTLVVPLLFEPLIGNAFKHGVCSTCNTSISIDMHEHNGTVTCEVVNTFCPKSKSDKSGNGIGLDQVQQRLDLQYPGRYTWEKKIIDAECEGGRKNYYTKLTINT